MLADASGFLDYAARQAPCTGAENASQLPLRGKSVNNRDRELPGVRTVAQQVEHLLNSPKKRAQQAYSKNQAGRGASLLQQVGNVPQSGFAGFPPSFPLRKVFRVPDQMFHQRRQGEKTGSGNILIVGQRQEVSR